MLAESQGLLKGVPVESHKSAVEAVSPPLTAIASSTMEDPSTRSITGLGDSAGRMLEIQYEPKDAMEIQYESKDTVEDTSKIQHKIVGKPVHACTPVQNPSPEVGTHFWDLGTVQYESGDWGSRPEVAKAVQ